MKFLAAAKVDLDTLIQSALRLDLEKFEAEHKVEKKEEVRLTIIHQ